MSSIGLILALLMAVGSGPATAPPTYSGSIRLPVDLYSAEGAHLEKGDYAVEVKQENGRYSLVFLQNDKTQSTIIGEPSKDDGGNEQIAMPLIGTQFLRSSADPVRSEAERHFSKTGLPQYEEESRDWKATLRVYTTRDQKQAVWLFEERQTAGKWSHIQFKLNLNPQ